MKTLVFSLLTIMSGMVWGQYNDYSGNNSRNPHNQGIRIYEHFTEPNAERSVNNRQYGQSRGYDNHNSSNDTHLTNTPNKNMEQDEWLYTGECGGAGGFPFEHILPVNADIRGIKVYRSARNPYLTGMEVYYLDNYGQQQILRLGKPSGVHGSFAVPRGARLTAISGQAGRFLNSIRFHFSNGTSTQQFGGNGGSRNYHISIPDNARFLGFYGGYGDYIDRLGMIGEY